MDTRKVATEYRMVQWAQILQAKQTSGQSIGEFCEASGISRNTYFYWQRKLREAACTELATRGEETQAVPNGWARLSSAGATGAAEGVSIEVSGCRIIVTKETNPELLVKICRALREL